MSEQKHYDKLGVDENSSFEEIQDARNRLVEECSGDRKELETIEAAYDAILMDRLRLRQEGKIKVPDRIRFPERMAEAPPQPISQSVKQTPDWLQRFLDNPSQSEILWPAIAFLGTAVLSIAAPPGGLALGVGFCIYFLNRKEHKFVRAFLMTLVTLIVGVSLGLMLGGFITPQLAAFSLDAESFAALVTAFLMWLISSFLR